MSLATRCTACGTVFRVVQDQLRVSGGWVRCGRCGEVFNAVESLVDLEVDRPAAGAATSAHGGRVMQDLARVAGLPADEPPPADAVAAAPVATRPAQVQKAAAALLARDAVAGSATDAAAEEATEDTAEIAAEDAAHGAADHVHEPPERTGEAGRATADDRLAPAADAVAAPPPAPVSASAAQAAAAPTLDETAPSFLRQAERAARWRRPRVRVGLALLALLTSAALLWQLTLVQHDLMAARWPALRPAIERVCLYGGCTVEPPRRIDGLTVESSGLVRAGPPGAYRLSLVLRNREQMSVRVPFVDFALTDAEGRLLARRVLAPAQLGASGTSLAAGVELPLAATLRVRDAAVVGYTIEIFYP